MTVAADLANRLNADAELANSAFLSVVTEYGMGVVDLMPDGGYAPGASVMLEIEVARDAAESYSEGDPLPDPIESTYVRPKVDFVHFRGVIRESGHERRKRGLNDAGLSIPDVDRKLRVAAEAIAYQIALYYDGTSADQIQGMIDSTTNFLDTSRSTYTALASYELDGSSHAISTALLGKWLTVASDEPYNCIPDVVLASATQIRRIRELGSQLLALPSASGPMALVPTMVEAIPGVPIVMVPNLTTSILLALSGVRSGSWRRVWNEPNPGRYHVLDLGAANSDTTMNLQISTALAIVCDQPQKQAKLTALSTG